MISAAVHAATAEELDRADMAYHVSTLYGKTRCCVLALSCFTDQIVVDAGTSPHGTASSIQVAGEGREPQLVKTCGAMYPA